MSRLNINKEEILNNKSHMRSLDKFPTIYVNTDNVTDLIKSEELRHSQMNKSCILLAMDNSSDFVRHFSNVKSFEIITPKDIKSSKSKKFTTSQLLTLAERARCEGKRICIYKPFECLSLSDGGDRRLADVLWIFSLWMPVNTTFIYSVSELSDLIHNNTKILYRFKSHGDIVRDMSRVREVSVRYGIEGTSRTYVDKDTKEYKKTDRRHSYNIKSVDLSSKSGDTVESLYDVMDTFLSYLPSSCINDVTIKFHEDDEDLCKIHFMRDMPVWRTLPPINILNRSVINDMNKVEEILSSIKFGSTDLWELSESYREQFGIMLPVFYAYFYIACRINTSAMDVKSGNEKYISEYNIWKRLPHLFKKVNILESAKSDKFIEILNAA